MRVPVTQLVAAIAMVTPLATAASCSPDRQDSADRTGKVIDDTTDEAAETRADIQDKQEQLARDQDRDQDKVAAERGKFIAATERTLENLDRQIAQLKADVAQRGAELDGEARQDVQQKLADMDNARAEAQGAFDRFRQATSQEAAKGKQATQTAIERTKAAQDALRGRVGDQDQDPDMRGVDEEPVRPPPPPTSADSR